MQINLVNGKITQKSGFNFQKFVSVLDTNVKYSLTVFLLRSIGLTLKTEDNSLIMELNDAENATKFYNWIEEKQKYLQSKNIGVVEKV